MIVGASGHRLNNDSLINDSFWRSAVPPETRPRSTFIGELSSRREVVMHTRDIPAQQWKPFLDAFTQLHRGEPLDVEMIGGGRGPQSKLCARPFLGVVAIADCGE